MPPSRQLWTHILLRPKKKWNGKGGDPRWAHAKYDGHRVCFFKDKRGEVCAFGRDHRPHLEMLSRFPRLLEHDFTRWVIDKAPNMSSFDCEAFTNGAATSVPSALRGSGDFTLQVMPFAVPFWEGRDMSGVDLDLAMKLLPYHAEYVPFQNNPKCLMRQAVDNNMEGWVLKEANYEGWWKLKDKVDADLVIIGTTEGDGKYTGQIGSLVLGFYRSDEEVCSVSGMSDAARRRMTNMLSKGMLLGKVVEISYNPTRTGGIRHPNFNRFRPDKPARECTKI